MQIDQNDSQEIVKEIRNIINNAQSETVSTESNIKNTEKERKKIKIEFEIPEFLIPFTEPAVLVVLIVLVFIIFILYCKGKHPQEVKTDKANEELIEKKKK